MSKPTLFHEKNLVMIVVAIMTKRLGGSVRITQADIDEVAYNTLNETWDPDGSVTVWLKEREKVS